MTKDPVPQVPPLNVGPVIVPTERCPRFAAEVPLTLALDSMIGLNAGFRVGLGLIAEVVTVAVPLTRVAYPHRCWRFPAWYTTSTLEGESRAIELPTQGLKSFAKKAP